jgi:hypothetical protein
VATTAFAWSNVTQHNSDKKSTLLATRYQIRGKSICQEMKMIKTFTIIESTVRRKKILLNTF